MKNIIFLFDLTVYSVQIASLILTLFLLLKRRNKPVRYYFIVLSVTLLDNITNAVRDFLNIAVAPEKIILILINYFSSILLMLWFFYSAYLVHHITGKVISRKRFFFILIVSLYPVFYVVSDVVFYGLLKFTPSTEFFSFCEISTMLLRGYYLFIFFYTSLILFLYRKNITDEKMKYISRNALIFSLLFIPAFIIDFSSILNGFYLYLLLILCWNIYNIIYLWKNEFSKNEATVYSSTSEDTGTTAQSAAPLGNGVITIREGESYIFVKYDEIITVKASNKRTVLKTINRSYTTDYTLSELDEKSNGKLLRVHRNTVINPNRIKKVEKYFSGTFAVIMENDEIVEMSRRISSVFRKNYLQ